MRLVSCLFNSSAADDCNQLAKGKSMYQNTQAVPSSRSLPKRVVLPSAPFSPLPGILCVALATDYDGTAADHGRVSDRTLEWLRKFRRSGRRLFLVTGRVLKDLESVFNGLDLFDCIVAENGGVLYS